MPKHRTLLIALALVAIGVGVLLCRPARPHFTEDQFDQIQIGMTHAKVEAVLGCGPGDHAQLGPDDHAQLESMRILFERHTKFAQSGSLRWVADEENQSSGSGGVDAIAVQVWFDNSGKVIGKTHIRFTYARTTLSDRLRVWVGW